MLWLGSGRTLLCVSSASVLRVISPTLSGLHLSDCKDHKRQDIQCSQIYISCKTDSKVDLQMNKSKQVELCVKGI